MKNRLPKGQGNRNNAAEDITTQSVKKTVTRQLKSLQPKGQGHCSNAIEKPTIQSSTIS